MSKFTDDVILKVERESGRYEVYQEFEYYQETNKESKIIVPKGFKTDLASIPRLLWVAFPKNGKYQKAAILHDYLCVVHRLSQELKEGVHKGDKIEEGVSLPDGKEFMIWGKNENKFIPLTRYITDRIFLESMLVTDVPKWQAKLLYWSVRLYAITFDIK